MLALILKPMVFTAIDVQHHPRQWTPLAPLAMHTAPGLALHQTGCLQGLVHPRVAQPDLMFLAEQFYNGVLDGRAHGVFHGRIIVHKDAQKTDAKQTNRNLLLSDDAQIDTKPQLEIYADDVKCTHGATIGQIAEDALFYLRSRGLDEMEARRLLLQAFAGECLGRLNAGALPDYAEAIVQARLLTLGDPRIRKVAESTNKNGLSGARIERTGNHQSSQMDCPAGARDEDSGASGRSAVRAASTRRCAGS